MLILRLLMPIISHTCNYITYMQLYHINYYANYITVNCSRSKINKYKWEPRVQGQRRSPNKLSARGRLECPISYEHDDLGK